MFPRWVRGRTVCDSWRDMPFPKDIPFISLSCQSGDRVLLIVTSLQPCFPLPISLPRCLLLTLYFCIFSSTSALLSWRLGGCVPRVSCVILSVMVRYVYLLTLLFWILSNVTSAKMSPLWFAWWSQPSHHSLRAGPDLTESEKSYVVRCLLNKTMVVFLKRIPYWLQSLE